MTQQTIRSGTMTSTLSKMTIETVEAMMITIEEGDLPGKLLVALNLQTVVMAVDIAIAIKVAGVPIENAGESRKDTFFGQLLYDFYLEYSDLLSDVH